MPLPAEEIGQHSLENRFGLRTNQFTSITPNILVCGVLSILPYGYKNYFCYHVSYFNCHEYLQFFNTFIHDPRCFNGRTSRMAY